MNEDAVERELAELVGALLRGVLAGMLHVPAPVRMRSRRARPLPEPDTIDVEKQACAECGAVLVCAPSCWLQGHSREGFGETPEEAARVRRREPAVVAELPDVVTLTCLACRSQFRQGRKGRRRVVCSKECEKALRRQRHRARAERMQTTEEHADAQAASQDRPGTDR